MCCLFLQQRFIKIYYLHDPITMKIFLIVTLIFAGFEIQDNLAFKVPD